MSFHIIKQMDWEVDELDELCKVVTVFSCQDAVSDHPVHGHGAAGRLELVTADEVRDVLHGDQLPLRHLAVIVGGCEGLGKLEIEHILRVGTDALTNAPAPGPVEEGDRASRP